MPWETVHFTRQQLYQLVWERPVQAVARSMGVSDVALGKTCRRLGVPVPGRGYWARKAAGASVHQPPLPPPKPKQPMRYTVRRWINPPHGEPKAGGEQSMKKPEPVTVPDELTDPHKLLVASLPLLRQAKELREDLLEREACLSITVQIHALMDRAIRIMDTLLKELEARGYSVEVTPPRRGQPDTYGKSTVAPSETVAHIGETVIRFGIQEGSYRVAKTPKERRSIFETYGPRPSEYKIVPNGKLSLCIYSHHSHSRLSRRTWMDGKRQRVENCLGSFLHTVSVIAEGERLERIAEKRLQIEREEQRRKEEERERRRALEAARVRDLNRRLHYWKKAKSIRDLAVTIEQAAHSRGEGVDSQSDIAQWLEWARGRADRLERRAIRGLGSQRDP